jgi:hypothetical protein
MALHKFFQRDRRGTTGAILDQLLLGEAKILKAFEIVENGLLEA